MVPRYQGSGNAGGEKTGGGARDERSQCNLSATSVEFCYQNESGLLFERGSIYSHQTQIDKTRNTSDMAALLVGAMKDRAAIWTPTDAGARENQMVDLSR